MLSMCLLFCFVIFWMLCCVMCDVDNKDITLIVLGPRSLGSAQIQPWALNGP